MKDKIRVQPDESLADVAQRELVVNARIVAVRVASERSPHALTHDLLDQARDIEDWILRESPRG